MLKMQIVIKEMKRLQMIYDKNWDEPKFMFKVEEYYKKLKNLSEESFLQGVEKAINEYDRFPTIHQLKEQCQATRGRKETKVEYVATDNTILDEMYNNMDAAAQKDIKYLAFELMKKIGMIPKGYEKNKDKWCDGMIGSSFNSAFKYIVLRKYMKGECLKAGYKVLGEVKHSIAGWVSFEDAFAVEIQVAK